MPRIGLTVSHPFLPETDIARERVAHYVRMTAAAGAELIPLYLDEWEHRAEEVAQEFDGLMLSGGADLAPSCYGQEPIAGAGLDIVSQRRPDFDRAAVTAFLAVKKPILGICYGVQFLNVYFGGSLVQDIALQVPGAMEHRAGVRHGVTLAPGSLLRKLVGESSCEVPSYHHQSVLQVAPGARVAALAPDGVIEALEWAQEPFLCGVQWHPERDADGAATRNLMAAFVGACAR